MGGSVECEENRGTCVNVRWYVWVVQTEYTHVHIMYCAKAEDAHKLLHHVCSVPVAVPQVPTQVHCIKLETSGYQSVSLNISHSAASWGAQL